MESNLKLTQVANSTTTTSSTKLWGGRFQNQEKDFYMEQLNQSIQLDKRLYKQDIEASIAYAHSLYHAKLINEEEVNQLEQGLKLVLKEWESNQFQILEDDEDIHTANERRLTELIGPLGGKLHTGRSRNDQVATDVRLWLRLQIDLLLNDLNQLLNSIVTHCEKYTHLVFPGYTHLQRAQPIRYSHWLLSFGFRFLDDRERLIELRKRVNRLPLGAGALAGNPFKVDQNLLAKELEFDSILPNSLNSVSERDFILEVLFFGSTLSLHWSQLAEDLIIYASKEFDFVKLGEAHSTGSSLMPQKRNPDALELLRGKAGTLFGKLSGWMMTLKGLPTSYNKDLQEDKQALFYCIDTLQCCIPLLSNVITQMEPKPVSMKQALTSDLLITDIADYLVRKGIPFRQSHHIAGQLVKESEDKGVEVFELDFEIFKKVSDLFDTDVFEIRNDFEACCERRDGIGGTSLRSVKVQIDLLKDKLKN